MDNRNNSLGLDALKLTGSKAVVLVITMISGMLLSRFRSLTEYGTYSQLIMVITLATTIITMGLPNSLNFFLARAETENERTRFLSVYYSLNTILSIIVGIVLVIITPALVAVFENPLITGFIYFLALFPWTRVISSSIENVLIVYKKSNGIIAFRLLNSLLLLGIIILVQVAGWSFNIYMLLYLLVESVFSIAVYLIVKKLAPKLCFCLNRGLIKKIFTFSVPLGLASMVGTLDVELDKFVIGALMSTEEMAIYTNASKEMPVTIIATSITAVLMPQMARLLKNKKNQQAIDLWGSATIISFAVISFFSLALIVFAPEVMAFLYSEKYLAGVPVFRIYSLGLMLRCTYYGMILNSSGRTKFILYSSIASLILNVILNFSLVYTLGVIGPAIATLISSLVVLIAQLLATSKITQISFQRIFPWKQLFKVLLINISIATAFVIVKRILPLDQVIGSIGEAIVLGIIWCVVALGALRGTVIKNWKALNAERAL